MKDLIYYVYKHTDPVTKTLLYIGHGCRGRAWIHGSKRSVLRSQEHLMHLETLTQKGLVATDWVELLATGLTKKEACQLEQSLIRSHGPLYNKPNGKHLLRMTPDKMRQCKELREQGLSYSQVADATQVSAMTVYRALNGQTKNIGETYAEQK